MIALPLNWDLTKDKLLNTSWIEKEVEEKEQPETQKQRDKDIRRTFLSKSYLV